MNHGGKAPKICDGNFTNYNKAKQVLESYLREGDRQGQAVFPSKNVDVES